ncbi:MAG TPA: thiamine-phosphate kinase [Gemmatimonadaceae bacterium]|nr:thiamine-phosphate kinase [Gemmatimonadaceae bacterium]
MNTDLRPGTEFDLVRRLLARWRDRADGIGDDGVVLFGLDGGKTVISTDASVENVHFRRDWLEPREIGYRATAAALSDLAAMAASPLAILLALTIPESWKADVDAIADGIGEAAEQSGARIVGGDLSEGRDLAIVVTVIGTAERTLTRSGARVGDRVYVTGRLGGPGAAVAALTNGRRPSRDERQRFAHPIPRIREAQWLAAHGATAGTDVSDGLVADLENIAVASGHGIVLDLDRVPVMASVSSRDAAASGEEYELAITASNALDTKVFEAEFGVPLTEIGKVDDGNRGVVTFENGVEVKPPAGYVHFT